MTLPSPDRRTLLRGAAWGVPAVAVAAAAPAFAASSSVDPRTPTGITLTTSEPDGARFIASDIIVQNTGSASVALVLALPDHLVDTHGNLVLALRDSSPFLDTNPFSTSDNRYWVQHTLAPNATLQGELRWQGNGEGTALATVYTADRLSVLAQITLTYSQYH